MSVNPSDLVACKRLEKSAAGYRVVDVAYFLRSDLMQPNYGGQFSRYDKLGQCQGNQTYSHYAENFDMSLKGESKTVGYNTAPDNAPELRRRVMEYLFTQGRNDSDAADHMRRLLTAGFFNRQYGSLKGNLTTVEKILFDYLSTQCDGGAKRAKQYIGYQTTEKKWVEKELYSSQVFRLLEEGETVKTDANHLHGYTKYDPFFNTIKNLPGAVILKVWVEEEVEI